MGHVETVRADHRALSAERAGIHRLIQLVVAHDDLRVVEDFTGQEPRIFFVMLEVGAALHALVAVALDAAAGFFDSLLFGVAAVLRWNPCQFLCRGKIRIEAALIRILLTAHVARVEILCKAVHRQGGLFRLKGGGHHSGGTARYQFLFLAVLKFRFKGSTRKQTCKHGFGNTEHIKGGTLLCQEVCSDAAGKNKGNVFSIQALQFQSEGFLVQKFRPAAQKVLQVRLLTEHRDRVGLLFELSRQKQRKQPGT